VLTRENWYKNNVFANGNTIDFKVSENSTLSQASSCLIIKCVPCSLASLSGLREFI
jgi:hypothetical protein